MTVIGSIKVNYSLHTAVMKVWKKLWHIWQGVIKKWIEIMYYKNYTIVSYNNANVFTLCLQLVCRRFWWTIYWVAGGTCWKFMEQNDKAILKLAWWILWWYYGTFNNYCITAGGVCACRGWVMVGFTSSCISLLRDSFNNSLGSLISWWSSKSYWE